MREKKGYVYIMTNSRNTALYTGITSNLEKRIYEHKNRLNGDSFTTKYNINKLVYFEETSDIEAAIEREKKIKSGSRKKKIELIEKLNKEWLDLSEGLWR